MDFYLENISDFNVNVFNKIFIENNLLSENIVKDAKLIKTFQGGTSELGVFNLKYSKHTNNLPNKFVVKITHPNHYIAGLKEVRFYQSIANFDTISFPIAQCYASCIDEKNKITWLIRDYFPDGIKIDWLVLDLSIKYYSRAIESLAELQAHFFDNEQLGKNGLGKFYTEEDFFEPENFHKGQFDQFIDFLGERINSRQKELLLIARDQFFPTWWQRIKDRQKLTLIHGDFNSGNFVIPEDESQKVFLHDWQSLSVKWPGADLSYLLYKWPTETRRKYENELLNLYYTKFIQSGVKNYSYTEFYNDYRLMAFTNFFTPVWRWHVQVEESNWFPLIEKAVVFYEDHHCDELITI